MRALTAEKGALEVLVLENYSETFKILSNLKQVIKNEDYIVIDTEHDQDFSRLWVGILFRQKIVLFSLAKDGDKFNQINKNMLADILNASNIIKVFHDTIADTLAFSKLDIVNVVATTIDTKLLATVARLPQSLDELAIHFNVGRKLNGSTNDNWASDNISDNAAIYCANDIAITSKILSRMLGRSEEFGSERQIEIDADLKNACETFIDQRIESGVNPSTREKWVHLIANGLSPLRKKYHGNDGTDVAEKLYDIFKDKFDNANVFKSPMFSSTSPPKKLNLSNIDSQLEFPITQRIVRLEEKVEELEINSGLAKTGISTLEERIEAFHEDLNSNYKVDKETITKLEDLATEMKGLRQTMLSELDHITQRVRPVIDDVLQTFQDHVSANTDQNEVKQEINDGKTEIQSPRSTTTEANTQPTGFSTDHMNLIKNEELDNRYKHATIIAYDGIVEELPGYLWH